jgi:hypothetical protein
MRREIEFDFKVSNRYKFYITEDGHVYKVDTRNGKEDECYYHISRGYKRIRVTDIETGKRRYLRVHRLVAKYYVPNPKPNEYNLVNHIDCDTMNNHYTNLEWCNTSINTQHAYDNGLIKDRGGWKSTPYSQRINK